MQTTTEESEMLHTQKCKKKGTKMKKHNNFRFYDYLHDLK